MPNLSSAAAPDTLLPTIIKSSLILGALGSLLGVMLTLAWGLGGGGDTWAVGVFTIIVGGILGSMFGTLGVSGAYFAATQLSANPEKSSRRRNRLICASTFAGPSTLIVLLMNIVSMTVMTFTLIAVVGLTLAAYAYFVVCPKILVTDQTPS